MENIKTIESNELDSLPIIREYDFYMIPSLDKLRNRNYREIFLIEDKGIYLVVKPQKFRDKLNRKLIRQRGGQITT